MYYSKKKLLFFCIFISTIFIIKSDLINYSSNSFKESSEHINNPDQGFYRPLLVYLKPDSFKHGNNYPEQVYHLRCDISQFISNKKRK